MKTCSGLFVVVWLASIAQADPVGMFTDVKDIGAVSRKAEASFEPATATYSLGASGTNVWGERDEFSFAWKPANGDASFAAHIEIQGASAQEHRKAGLMFRQTLEPDSPYVDVMIHGNGLTSLQFRLATGGPTREIQCARDAPAAVRLEKRGDYVLLQLSDVNGRYAPSGCSIKLPFKGVFYAGLAVCAHDNTAFETATFRNVTLGLLPRRPEIRTSTIEILPVGSLDRRVIYTSQYKLDSPSFTGAGNAVCFREDGRLMYYSLTANADAHLVGAENADECALARPVTTSPLLVSSEVKGSRAQIVKRTTRDSKPTHLTSDQYLNWSPRLSPNGESMVFISGTTPPVDGKPATSDYLLREMPVDGGEARELARFFGGPGALGPAPWSTDGKQIVFMSREPE